MYCDLCKKTGGCKHTDTQFPYSMPAEMLRLERILKETQKELEKTKKELEETRQELKQKKEKLKTFEAER